MSKLEKLCQSYENFISGPWADNLSGVQRVIFVVYDKAEERSLRFKLPEFEIATNKAQHRWRHQDLTNEFPQWMASEEYREAYFQCPEDLEILLPQFKDYLCERIITTLTHNDVDRNTVVALSGLAGLFGFVSVSEVIEGVASHVRGRLLVFFPGDRDGTTYRYRFLDARDGWDYMAVPITA